MSRSRGPGGTPGTPRAQSPRDGVGVPSSSLAALWDATWPGPGSCAGQAQGNEQGEGPGLRQHHPPTGKRPQAAIALWGSPGQPRQERGRARLRTGAGTEAFLSSCLSVPAVPRGCWCPTLATLRQPPPPAVPGAGVPPASRPQRSLLAPPRVLQSNAEGRSRLHAPRANGQGTKNVMEMRKKQGKKKKTIVKKKKIVTKGKTTNSLAEYEDLESDGATTASLERRGHGHAPPTSSTTFGALGAQRAGVRRVRAPAGRRRAGREPGLLNAHRIRGEALGRGGKRRVRPQQRAAAPARARRPCPLNCELCGTAPARLSPPPAAPPTRPPGRWGTCGLPAGNGDGESERHHRHSLDPPRTTGKAGTTSREWLIPALCLAPAPSACRPPTRQHPIPTAPQEGTPLPTAGTGSTFNHLSTHLAWNSWLQGRTRRSCRASKSLKHTTHLGKQPSVLPHCQPGP